MIWCVKQPNAPHYLVKLGVVLALVFCLNRILKVILHTVQCDQTGVESVAEIGVVVVMREGYFCRKTLVRMSGQNSWKT